MFGILAKKVHFMSLLIQYIVYCLILIIHVQGLSQTYTLYQQVSNAKHVYPFKKTNLVIYYCITKETVTEDV